MKLKNLSHRLQFKMKKSRMHQHELKKIYAEFTINGKPDRMNKKIFQRNEKLTKIPLIIMLNHYN